MFGKRQATSDLNHENWNVEENPEDRGQFRTASADEMKSRVIKKARRKVAGGCVDDAGDEPKNVFSGFTGFGKTKSTTTSSSPFSFLSKIPSATLNSVASKVHFSATSNSSKDSEDEKQQVTTDINDKWNVESEDFNKKVRRLDDGASDERETVFSGFSGFGKKTNSTSTITSPFTKVPAATSGSTASKDKFSFSNDSVEDCEIPSTSNVAPYFSKISGANSVAPTTTAGNDNTNNNFSFGESGKSKALEKPATITSGALIVPVIGSNVSMFNFGNKPSGPKNSSINSSHNGDKSSEFCAKLVNLNRKITDWIKQHVDLIEDEEENRCASNAAGESKFDGSPETALSKSGTVETFKFTSGNKANLTPTSSGTSIPETKPLFSFGITSAAKKPLTESSDAKKLSTQSTSAPSTEVGIFSGFGTKSPVTTDKKLGPPTPPGIFNLVAKPLTPKTPTTADTSIKSTFSFKTTTTTNDDNKNTSAKTESNGFSFGIKPMEKSKPDVAVKPFSLTNNAAITQRFSFGQIEPPAAIVPPTVNTDETQDEEDSPPKVDFKQVKEEDALYSKKCKVFVKKNDNFADRGVGTLHLKPIKDSEKTQLIVRADTNLGNILVNLILSEATPSQRMGKNNVMLVCVPSPDVKKPTPTLFRVKTSGEADELLEMIKKHTK